MNLVYIITGLSTGGAEMMLLKLLQNMDRNLFSPAVISLTTMGAVGPRIEALGITVYALGMRPGLPSPIKFMRLTNLVRKLKPDVVHTWMYHADLLGGFAARVAGIKVVVWGIRHSNLSRAYNKRATLLVVNICAHVSGWQPKRVLTCSERSQSIHVEAGYCTEKMMLIPNGFDLSYFQPDRRARCSVRAELGLVADTPLVGLIARYDPQKNHSGFIEAAASVHKALPQVHFILAGTGVEKSNKDLTSHILRAGLRECVHMLGRRDDIPRLMASLDLLASSSFGEAFPNVLGEAMACNVPCVVTDVGDSAEIVGDTGRVVAPGDMPSLARHLIDLLQLPKEELGQQGIRARQRICARYDITDVTRRYEEFYLQLNNKGV